MKEYNMAEDNEGFMYGDNNVADAPIRDGSEFSSALQTKKS